MNMKKTIYTAIATLLFLISSCTLEQEVYNKINPGMFPQNAEVQSPNQKIPDRKTKCVIETYLNIKQNVIFGAK